MTRHADCTTPQRAAPGHDLACVTRADHDPLDGFALRRGGLGRLACDVEPGAGRSHGAVEGPRFGWVDEVHEQPVSMRGRTEKGKGPAPTQLSLAGPSLAWQSVLGRGGAARRVRAAAGLAPARWPSTRAPAGSPSAAHGTPAGAAG